jgi:hypothetical protein
MAHGSAPASAINLQNTGDVPLLIRALTASEPEEAYGAWRRWYSRADINRLPWECWQIIPALGESLHTWLRDDPAAGIFQGVVRRAWTEAQLRMTAARSAIDSIEQNGCAPVLLAGPAIVSLLNRRKGSVRPVSILRLVVHRDQLSQAAGALESTGWKLSGELPPLEALDWMNCVFFSRNEIGLMLHWRLLPISGPLASACEAEFLAHHQSVTCCGRQALIPAPEHTLLAALSERMKPDPDLVPWQVDAALLPLDTISWPKWTALAAAYAPEAFDRLDEMRSLGFDVPKLTRPAAPKPASTTLAPKPASAAPARVQGYKRLYRSLRHRAGRLVRRFRH